MKIHHVKRIWSRPLFAKFQKHYCPVCGEKLNNQKVSQIVHSQSEEAKNYDFSSAGDGYMTGNVKFIWTEFVCTKCKKNYPVDIIYQAEKTAK